MCGLLCFLLTCCGDHETTEQQRQAIDQAYRQADEQITRHAGEIHQSIISRKEKTREVAEELTGLKAAWTLISESEEGLHNLAKELIAEHLISEKEMQELLEQHTKSFVIELRDIEDSLAQQANCPSLSAAQTHTIQSTSAHVSPNQLNLTDGMQQQLFTELASIVGAEAATQLLISSGILGTAGVSSAGSFGISLAVGIIVDAAVRWYMDPAADVTLQLDTALDEAAAKQAQQFRTAMQQYLQARRDTWFKEISAN